MEIFQIIFEKLRREYEAGELIKPEENDSQLCLSKEQTASSGEKQSPVGS